MKEYLVENGISQKELSVRTNMSEKHISNVLTANCRLTKDFALKLENNLVKSSVSFRLIYETKYCVSLVREEEIVLINE